MLTHSYEIQLLLSVIKIIYTIMTHVRQSFLIPELNVVANDAQLKNLQSKLLFEHYSRAKLARSYSQQKPNINYHNPEDRVQTEMDYYAMKNKQSKEKVFKNELATFYAEQINRKQLSKKRQKQQQKRQEQEMIQRAQGQIYIDKLRSRQINEGFKKQALSLLQYRQERRLEQKKRLEEQKQVFQRRYSNNLQNFSKQQSFRKHYVNVNGALQQNQRNYLNHVAPANRIKQQQKQRLIYDSGKDKQSKMREQLQKQFMAAERYRNQLRDSLVMQIKQKQQKKKHQIDQMRNNGYTSAAYLQRHHPINNPVDFKITHDNRYIIKELQSGLARSGSQSIIS